MNRAIMSIISTLIFATILTFFPNEYFTVLLIYFVLFFAISTAMGIRMYRRGMATSREISRGKPILEIDDKEVNKLLDKDKELLKELRSFSKASLMPLLMFPAFMIVAFTLFPILPPLAERSLGSYIGRDIARFLSYVALFGLFSAISLITFKPQTFPRIIRNLRVYETGLIIDKSLGLKAPIEIDEYLVNEERKFVEFKLNNQRYRIYYKDIKELNNVLSKIVVLKQSRK